MKVKTLKKALTFVLSISMLMTMLVLPVYAAAPTPDPNKAQIYLDYLGKNTDAITNGNASNLPTAPVTVEQLKAGDTIWVGYRIVNASKCPAFAAGLYNFGICLDFDSEYIAPGWALTADEIANEGFELDGTPSQDAIAAAWAYTLKKYNVTNKNIEPDKNLWGRYTVDSSNGYGEYTTNSDGTKLAENLTTTTNRNSMLVNYQLASASASYLDRYKKITDDTGAYLVRFPIKVLKDVPAGRTVLQAGWNGTDVSLTFGQDGTDGLLAWDETGNVLGAADATANLKVTAQYMGDIEFPAPKATFAGTASITGTLTYGQSLSASFTADSSISANYDSSKTTYQWYRTGSATPVGTGASYQINSADVGKTIKVVVSNSDYDGTVEFTTANTIEAATLTVTAPSVKDKVFDNKTTAAVTADPTFTGKLGSDDVKVKATATFDNANAGNGKTVNLAYSLDGTAKAAYKLNKTSDTATANITKAPLTVVGENKTVKVGGKVTLTAKVTGEVGGASAGVTYTYALKDGDAITVSGNEATGVKAGSATVTVTGAIGNTTNYEFASGKNTADATVTVSDKVAAGITIKTQPQLQYEAGAKLNLSGLEVTVTYDDHSSENVAFADFASKGINASPAHGTELTVADHHNKSVTVTVGDKSATTANLEVVAAATKVTLKTKGAATKVYDNSTAFGKAVWTTEPVFESNNGTVDTSKAVYTFADKNAGNCEITVTGLTVNGEPASISDPVADGTITKANPELVIGNLAQRVGNVTALTVETDPADDKAIADKFTYEIDIKTTDGGINFVDWDDANVNGLQAGSYNVVVNYAGSDNTKATTEAAILVLSKRSSGGGGGVREYTVRFAAGEHGTIDGKTSVSVEKDAKLKSSDVPTVKADEGYKFIGWSLDGKTVVDPTKEAVTGSLSYTALYQKYNAHKTYMSGYSDGTFRPDGRTTRAEVASLMAGLIEGFDKDAAYNSTLNDVEDGAWYAQAVKFMSQKGLISGYNDGSYRPDNQITRQEFCAIIAKYMGLNGEGTANFNDVAEAWGKGYIGQLAAKGIVNGYPDGSFQPDKAITRAEVVTILNKVFDRTPDAELVDENIDNYTVKMSDVSKAHWAYIQILEAAVEHEMTDFHK